MDWKANDMEINTTENNKPYSLKNQKSINYRQGKYALSRKYHNSEIDLNELIIKNAIKMIWVGIAMLIAGTIFAAIKEEGSWIAVIPGAFVDLFSGTMLHLINKSSESKQKYFNELAKDEREQRLIDELHEISDIEYRKEMLSEIIKKN